MDDVVRSGRLLLRAFALASVLAIAGCHHAEPLEGIGRATEVSRTLAVAAAPSAAEDVGLPSPIAPDFATTLARVGPDSFVAYGHAGGRYAATAYVTPEAKESFVHREAAFAPGTDFVLTSVDRTSHKPGPTFFMHKEPPHADGLRGTWRFGIVEVSKATHEELALCARCHADAQHDDVFALPE